MSSTTDEVYRFLDAYRRAFDAFDTEAIAASYLAPCLLVESGRAFALPTHEDVLANMRALVAQYRTGGYRRAAIARHEIRAQGSGLAHAIVDWEVVLGDRTARFTNSYQLVLRDGRWRIAASTLHAPADSRSP